MQFIPQFIAGADLSETIFAHFCHAPRVCSRDQQTIAAPGRAVMRIGVPKEIKVHEYRVGLTPAASRELVDAGHEVMVETGAGDGIGFADDVYQTVGARIAADAEEIFAQRRDDREGEGAASRRDARSCGRARCSSPTCTLRRIRSRPKALMKSGATCIAYETVTGTRRLAAAADADERSRGPHVDPGRRALPGESARRTRHAARRRARRGAGQCRDPGRRRRRQQRGPDGRRPARRRHGLRSLDEAAARAVVDLRARCGPSTRRRNPWTRW